MAPEIQRQRVRSLPQRNSLSECGIYIISYEATIESWHTYTSIAASNSMSSLVETFSELKSTRITEIISASSRLLSVKGCGDITVKINGTDFKNVLCVPGLTVNLLSVSQMVKNGNKQCSLA